MEIPNAQVTTDEYSKHTPLHNMARGTTPLNSYKLLLETRVPGEAIFRANMPHNVEIRAVADRIELYQEPTDEMPTHVDQLGFPVLVDNGESSLRG